MGIMDEERRTSSRVGITQRVTAWRSSTGFLIVPAMMLDDEAGRCCVKQDEIDAVDQAYERNNVLSGLFCGRAVKPG